MYLFEGTVLLQVMGGLSKIVLTLFQTLSTTGEYSKLLFLWEIGLFFSMFTRYVTVSIYHIAQATEVTTRTT
ncbi:hypothetical protein ACJX0J_009432, partial [Zea mays]